MTKEKLYLLTYICLSFNLTGEELAELTGGNDAESISDNLSVSITGGTGDSYSTDSSQTGNTTSNASIHNSFTFTAKNLPVGQSVRLSKIDFDYIRRSLQDSESIMDVYINTGDGYGNSVLNVTGGASSTISTVGLSLQLDIALENGQSVAFGFSFADRHGGVTRIHSVDDVILEGVLFNTVSGTDGILDLNNNGVSDLWEYKYNASDLVSNDTVKHQDYDGDGFTNIEEAVAGTDPYDFRSRLKMEVKPVGEISLMLDVSSELGKLYDILETGDLRSGLWTPQAPSILASGSNIESAISSDDGNSHFYRVQVSDVDGDNDGLSAWEEAMLGLSDNGSDDYNEALEAILAALNSTVSFSKNGNVLYEDETQGVEVTLTRTSPFSDSFIDLERSQIVQIVDRTKVASNSANGFDYYLADIDGDPLERGIATIEAGEESVTIRVIPLQDSMIEPDEQITLSVGDSSVDLWVADARVVSSEDYIAISRAGHFLSQASMGGTPETIAILANDIKSRGYLTACEAWIDAQVALSRDATTVTDDCFAFQTARGFDATASININNFELVWWGKMVNTNQQLRNRFAYSLSQVFVTSSAFWTNSERNDVWRSYTSYYDKLVDAAFSNHRSLLQTISYDPFMGVYLSFAQNRKADTDAGTFPDENYAREVMQLFSCGVYSQTQNGEYILDNGDRVENYDNEDIMELAEVFTGLGLSTFDGTLDTFDNPKDHLGTRYIFPMQMSDEHHDTSSKTLLDGTVIPAGGSGDNDISIALDRLALHPSTAPHLSRLLIKRLTSSNPSSAYIGRVTEAWRGEGTYGNGEVGNFVSIIKAILLDTEARNGVNYETNNITGAVTATPVSAIGGRIKEPIIKWLQFYRFAQSLSQEDDGVPRWFPLTKRASNDSTPNFGQIPMRAASVFNYYDSDYSPSLGSLAEAELIYNQRLTSPESEILSPYVIKQFESFYDQVNKEQPGDGFEHFNGVLYEVDYNYLDYLYRKNETVADFIDDINLWFCNGQVSPELKTKLVNAVNQYGNGTYEDYAKILSILFNSSEFSVSY